MHAAASLLHKLNVGQPQEENIAVGYCLFIIVYAPLYLPDRLVALP